MTDTLRYFNDLEIGYRWESSRRTVTETDIVLFAGISGDFNPLHMDEEFAKTTIFGKRIAHGLLGLSISTGLGSSEPPWLVMAFMGLDWKFVKPIFIGDTLHYVSMIKNMREGNKPDRGIVILERRLINQKEEVVQEGTFTLLVKRRG